MLGQLRLVYDKVTTGQWLNFMIGMGLVLQSPMAQALGTFAYAPSLWIAWYNLIGSSLSLVILLIGLVFLYMQFRKSFNKINWDLASDEKPMDHNSQFMKAIIYSAIVGTIFAFVIYGIMTLIALGIATVVPPL